MLIKRLEACIVGRPETNQRLIVVLGSGFAFGIDELVLVASFATALEPFVKEKSSTMMAGKWPRPVGRLQFTPINSLTQEGATILDVPSTNQFVIYTPTQFIFVHPSSPCRTTFLRALFVQRLSIEPRRRCVAHLARAKFSRNCDWLSLGERHRLVSKIKPGTLEMRP
jgi:hypothetical protein